MNLNRFLNMVVNVVTRRLINAGINHGLRWFNRRSASAAQPPVPPEEQQKQAARAAAKRARQAAKVTRRIGR